MYIGIFPAIPKLFQSSHHLPTLSITSKISFSPGLWLTISLCILYYEYSNLHPNFASPPYHHPSVSSSAPPTSVAFPPRHRTHPPVPPHHHQLTSRFMACMHRNAIEKKKTPPSLLRRVLTRAHLTFRPYTSSSQNYFFPILSTSKAPS